MQLTEEMTVQINLEICKQINPKTTVQITLEIIIKIT